MTRQALAVGVVVSALTMAAPAHAFCRSTTCTAMCKVDADGCKVDGKPLAWRPSCVGMSLQDDGSAFLPFDQVTRAFVTALEAWSYAPCPSGGGFTSMALLRQPNVFCASPEYNSKGTNSNAVIFHDRGWRYGGMENTLGFTTVTFDTVTGEILGADVEINAEGGRLTTSDTAPGFDLASVLTHEFGHALGLAHAPSSEAVMFASYGGGKLRREIQPDDRDGVCTAYTPTRDAVCDAIPHGGFETTCFLTPPAEAAKTGCGCRVGRPPASGGVLAVFLAVLAVFLRRRPRTPGPLPAGKR